MSSSANLLLAPIQLFSSAAAEVCERAVGAAAARWPEAEADSARKTETRIQTILRITHPPFSRGRSRSRGQAAQNQVGASARNRLNEETSVHPAAHVCFTVHVHWSFGVLSSSRREVSEK